MKLLLDLDGVIADFHRVLAEAHGIINPVWKAPGEWKIEKGYGIPEPWWEKCDQAFWENVPKTPEADGIVELICDLFKLEDICLFTSIPVKDKYFPLDRVGITAQGKIDWVQRHYPGLLDHFILGTVKHFSAGPDIILVEDLNHHVDDFKAHGGHAILLPKMWNRLHSLVGCDIVKYLENRLIRILSGSKDE